MKNYLLFVFIVLLAASCHTTKQASAGNSSSKTNTAGHDGTSFSKAVIIEEKSEMAGVSAEYAWLSQHYPDYKTQGQTMVYSNKKPYDLVKITAADGKEYELYFDISNYFGKF